MEFQAFSPLTACVLINVFQFQRLRECACLSDVIYQVSANMVPRGRSE